MIRSIIKKWQSILEIPGGGVRHLEFWYICIFDVTFPSNLVMIGPIVKKQQNIFKIQDGSGRHLEFS
jgi:hypothetical protein